MSTEKNDSKGLTIAGIVVGVIWFAVLAWVWGFRVPWVWGS